jgi:hypothetical protein
LSLIPDFSMVSRHFAVRQSLPETVEILVEIAAGRFPQKLSSVPRIFLDGAAPVCKLLKLAILY